MYTMPPIFSTRFFSAALFAVCLFLLPLSVRAAIVTNVYDQPSSLESTAVSNHRFSITVASNVDEGDTLIVTFPSAFDTSSITEDDVDVEDDSTDLTTAADCTGVEQASVVMAGDVLTITICAGDGGAITAGSVMVVEIGSNAAASGTGVNQIVNPSSIATYFVAISGTFGDTGSIPIPVVLDNTSNVSVVMPSTGGGGGSGEDVTPTPTYTVAVTAPNGGETLTFGNTYSVIWETTGSVDGVNILYSADNGTTYNTITDTQANTGAYTWTIPDVNTTLALIQVKAKNGAAIVATDQSDAVFTIVGTPPPTPEPEPEPTPEPMPEPTPEPIPTPTPIPTIEPDGGEPTVPPDTGGGGEPTPQPPPTTPEPTPTIPIPDEKTVLFQFQTGLSQIALEPVGDHIDVLPNTTANILLIPEQAEKTTKATLTFGDQNILLNQLSNGTYGGKINFGSENAVVTVVIDYNDGSTVTRIYNISLQSPGLIYEELEGSRLPLEGAVTIVYSIIDGKRTQWNGGAFGQENPSISASEGVISWYVPNGSYVVTAAKSGYRDGEKLLFVQNHILSPVIGLSLAPEEPVSEPTTPTRPTRPMVPPVVQAPQSNTQQAISAVFDVFTSINEIRDSPEAQVVAEVSQPVAIAAAITSAAILGSSFNLFGLLQYLFTAPVLFFARRRRQNFGLIYNAVTKVPVDLAIVRLMTDAGKLVRTMVTDQEGRYFFKVDPGRYRIEVVKNGFVFPSSYLKNAHEDGKLVDLYTGGVIEVKANSVIITANIPVDPSDAPEFHASRSIKFKRFLRILQNVVAMAGVIISFVILIIQPVILTAGLFVLQIMFYLATRFLAKPKKRKGWGIVREQKGKTPIANTIVRLFEPKYNKLLETTVTGRGGKYAFLAGPNEYYVTFEKPGYQKAEVRPIDYTKKTEPSPISVDVTLAKAI